MAATGTVEGVIRLWAVDSGKLVQEIYGHDANVREVTFAPHGKTLASASQDGTTKIWKVTAP